MALKTIKWAHRPVNLATCEKGDVVCEDVTDCGIIVPTADCSGSPPPYGQPAHAYDATIAGVLVVRLLFVSQLGSDWFYSDTGTLSLANWLLRVEPCGSCWVTPNAFGGGSALALFEGSFFGTFWFCHADAMTVLCEPTDPNLRGASTLRGNGDPRTVVITAVLP